MLVLQERFKWDRGLLNQKLSKTPLIKWNTVYELNTQFHLIIKKDSTTRLTNEEIYDFVEFLISDWIKKFAGCMESTETTNVYSYKYLLHEFDHQLSKLIKEFEKSKETFPFFQLTKECVFDVALTVSKQTEDLLISFEEKARNNDVKLELEKRKKSYMKLLFVYYDNKIKVQQELVALEKRYKEKIHTLKAPLHEEEQRYNAERESIQQEKETFLQEDKKNQFEEEQEFNMQMNSSNDTVNHVAEVEQTKDNFTEQEKQSALPADRLLDLHKKVVEYLSDVIGNAVTKALKDSMKYEIYKDTSVPNTTFTNKEKFKTSVLKLLLEKECFDEYRLYFTDPEKCFKKWMCYLVKEHYFKTDQSTDCTTCKFHKLRDCKLQELLEPIQTSITTTNIDSNNVTFSSWMYEFTSNMNSKSSVVSLGEDDIQSVSKTDIPWKSCDDGNAFKDLFLKQINQNLIKMNSQQFYSDIEDELMENIWKTFKKSFLGCTACCPFCNEMCDAKGICGKDEKHSVKLHRPQCFSKLLQHRTRHIAVDICTTSIGSDRQFRNNHTKWKWKSYRHYDHVYPNWFISNTTKPVESYWTWVVASFDKQIAEWCGGGKTKGIPDEWYKITKDKAEECLEN